MERAVVPDGNPVAWYFESLDFPVNDRVMNSWLADFPELEAGPVRLHHHQGIEFLYLLSGSLELTAGPGKYELSPGDSIYFDSGVPHGYRGLGGHFTQALISTVPRP